MEGVSAPEVNDLGSVTRLPDADFLPSYDFVQTTTSVNCFSSIKVTSLKSDKITAP